MNDDRSELLSKIAAQAKRAVCPGTAVLPRGAESVATAASIARLAQLPLYRIDLNAVTRKCVGQTEKNLDAVFDAARTDECCPLPRRGPCSVWQLPGEQPPAIAMKNLLIIVGHLVVTGRLMCPSGVRAIA